MYKKHQVILLPTKEIVASEPPNFIKVLSKSNPMFRDRRQILSYERYLDKMYVPNPHHLYILSDETIKEGWDGLAYKSDTKQQIFKHFYTTNPWYEDAKIVIATTDSTLGLPLISEEFIKTFIKAYNEQKPIIDVMVEYYKDGYKLIETRVGWKRDELSYELFLKVEENNTINTKVQGTSSLYSSF